jgi:hypothetical protein
VDDLPTLKTQKISQAEIDELKAKHAGVLRAALTAFLGALEIGSTLVEWHKRLGVIKGDRGSFWGKWAAENLPFCEDVAYKYMRLARNRQFLETKFNFTSLPEREVDLEKLPGIMEALRAIREKDAENRSPRLHRKVIEIEPELGNGSARKGDLWDEKPIKTLPPSSITVEPEERAAALEAMTRKTPVEEIADWLERYVMALGNTDRYQAEVCERIRVNEIADGEVRKMIDAACRNVPELKKRVLKAIL